MSARKTILKPVPTDEEQAEPRAAQSLVDAAAEVIRDRILDLTLSPGQPINLTNLVADLGLSRTPVREALNRLATEGLIRIESSQGVTVHPLDIVEINQLCEAFRICERIAAHMCDFGDPALLEDLVAFQKSQRDALRVHAYLDASRWNFRQRSRIAETCGNPYILDFYRKIASHMRRLSIIIYRMEARDEPFYLSQIAMLEGLHAGLVDAVRGRDRERLAESLMRHLDVFEERIANAVRNTRGRDFLAG
jgi:DNA-binding GntR family transcriptional regulator